MYSMTRKLMMISALSAGLLAAPAAMADRDDDRRYDRGSHWSESRQRDGHDRHRDERGHDRHHSRRHDDSRHQDRHDHRRELRRDVHHHHYHWDRARYHAPRYHGPRGHVRHHWRAGHRMPAAYRHHRYIVNDYHHYRLYQPPHGHHWVRVDNDVVLTAVATGVVAAVVYGIFQ